MGWKRLEAEILASDPDIIAQAFRWLREKSAIFSVSFSFKCLLNFLFNCS